MRPDEPFLVGGEVEDLADALASRSEPPGGSDPGTVPGLRRALLVVGDAARQNAALADALSHLTDRIGDLEARCRRFRVGRVEAPTWVWLVTLAVAVALVLLGRAQDVAAILRAVAPG